MSVPLYAPPPPAPLPRPPPPLLRIKPKSFLFMHNTQGSCSCTTPALKLSCRYKAHPWHGINPAIDDVHFTAYIEIVPQAPTPSITTVNP